MASANLDLKNQLFTQIDILGQEQSLLPFSDTLIDQMIGQLETINSVLQPLNPTNFSYLAGEWQLVYASNGTVVTRPIAEITKTLGSTIKVNKIWQSLNNIDGDIIANNQALIEFPLLGEYHLNAEGIWQPKYDQYTASVTFNLFSLQATKFLNQSDWILPEIQVPVLDFLQNEALWTTSYLDEDTRVGKGASGNLFLFRR